MISAARSGRLHELLTSHGRCALEIGERIECGVLETLLPQCLSFRSQTTLSLLAVLCGKFLRGGCKRDL